MLTYSNLWIVYQTAVDNKWHTCNRTYYSREVVEHEAAELSSYYARSNERYANAIGVPTKDVHWSPPPYERLRLVGLPIIVQASTRARALTTAKLAALSYLLPAGNA